MTNISDKVFAINIIGREADNSGVWVWVGGGVCVRERENLRHGGVKETKCRLYN